MVYQKFKSVTQANERYPTKTDLIYKFGFSRTDLIFINDYKEQDNEYVKLRLTDEKGKKLIYWNNSKIVAAFTDAEHLIQNGLNSYALDVKDEEIINGFIFSEIESTLAIEGVHSTRKEIEKLRTVEYKTLTTKNEIIIKNMLLGYDFIKSHEITVENIYKLYNLLSRNSLAENEKLQEGNFYRHDGVSIVNSAGVIIDRGVEYAALPRLMDELLAYINEPKTLNEHLLAAHIIHFYIVYLHPYFDYNGRMARVLSFWYNLTKAPAVSMLFLNEAISGKTSKPRYYNAIRNARDTDNDLTYFLEYLSEAILKHAKVYVNFYNITDALKEEGKAVSRAAELALKNVLAINDKQKNYFTWQDYKNSVKERYSKQYYFRLLNELVALDVLEVHTDKNTNFYRLNQKKFNLY